MEDVAERKDVEAVTPSRRPDWKNEVSYGPTSRWSYRRWAWEFLRRNPEYQERSENLKEAMSGHKKKLAHDFGRCNLKPFREPYGDDDASRLWLAETIDPKAGKVLGNNGVPRFELRPGYAILMVDLTQATKSGRAALTSLLRHAKELLAIELDKYEKTLPQSQRTKTPKVRRDKLFIWLRIYDAIEYWKVAEEDVIRVLYPYLFREGHESPDSGWESARKMFRYQLKRARQMVKQDYLTLVPLDYLQEKSSKKNNRDEQPGESSPTDLST